MPPTLTKVLDNVSATTRDVFIPRLVDNVFTAIPLLVRLLERDNIQLDGGDQIRQPIIYASSTADAYVGLEEFDTSDPETITDFVFDWKQYYANVTIKGIDRLKNAGGARVLNLQASKMTVAEMSLKNILGQDIFGDGTRKTGVLTGLAAAVDDGSTYTSYGGVSRTTGNTDLQAAAKANLDSTGGNITLDILQSSYGAATIGNTVPDLGVTTQALFDKIWARVQPQQRFSAGVGSDNAMARVGFNTIRFNNADIVVDPNVSPGFFYFLNTEYIFLIIHPEENFEWTGWKVPTNQNSRLGQILLATQLVVSSPRLQAKLTGLS